MCSQTKYDDALFGILHSEGQIVPFLDVIYSFLYRRTDFFKIQHVPSDKLGFPLGVAQQIESSVFNKFYQMALKEDHQQMCRKKKESEAEVPPPVAKIVEIESSETEDDQVPTPINEVSISTEVSPNQSNNDNKKKNKIIRTSQVSKPISEMTQEDFQKCAESYNGAARENYCWSQTLRDLDVRIKVPNDFVSGKLAKVVIDHTHLKVSIKVDDSWQDVVDGNLTWKVNVEESTWVLVPAEHIHVSLEKVEERWWTALLEDEPTIDTKGIDASLPFEDLDTEAQNKVEELMYNEHLKRLGKPTVKESKIHEILKEAWNKSDSPFKGQEFDPSTISVSNAEDFNG